MHKAIWNTANGKKRIVRIQKHYKIDGANWVRISYNDLIFNVQLSSLTI